ncbi:MAG: glycosyltransferase N-terminal domain-containing protein, partial [Campylobacter sp.]|nr:glycosyltransferase N-terminal domain-containing protein [Campylobacter sp.]
MYNAICAFLLVLASPFLLALSFGRKYKVLLSDELGNSRIPSKNQPKNSILARFFLLNNPALKPCDFYFHACSLGEVSTIEPFVKALQKEAKSVRITVCTATGYEKAREFCDEVAFLPFECFLPFWLKECKTLVVFEAELWLNL